MLIVGSKYKVLRYTIMMVSCMSVSEIFNPIDFKAISDLET
jgi:hypothetical protein